MDFLSKLFKTDNGPLWTALQHAITAFGILLTATQLLSAHDTSVVVQQLQKLIANFQEIVRLLGDSAVAIGIILSIGAPIYGAIRSKVGNRIADVKAIANNPEEPKQAEAKAALVVAAASIPEVNPKLTEELIKVAEVVKKENGK